MNGQWISLILVYVSSRLSGGCYVFPKELNDPCQDKQCNFGARCVPTPDGREAKCQCPESCPSYGDHVSSRPVCGSDGVDYKDMCELNKAACKSNSNITIKFQGKCDPCASVECPEPEVCQLDEQRNPICRCGETCPLEFTPVCGSDGKTYQNECTLRQEACRTRKSLNIIYRGKCSSGVNPCASVRCTQGEECSINKYGIARCECPPPCENVMRPVCASDGRTYSSECEMRRSACLARVKTTVSYAGVCGEMGPCSHHHCHYGAICVEKFGSASCECPSCPAEFEPVCGSDGISYGNECKLRLESCKHRREIHVLYSGPCDGCENKKCDFYSVCEADGATESKCVCPNSCDDPELNEGPVCGTDGVTYSSTCELQITSCKTKQYILVAYKADCDLCRNVECKFGARCEAGECVCPTNCEGAKEEPVCASNIKTFHNECELQKAACEQSPDAPTLTVLFYGNCSEKLPVTAALTTSPPSAATSNDGSGFELSESTRFVYNYTDTDAEKEACRDIHCDFDATCELGPDNFPRCSCQFDCASAALMASEKPVCASDLRIYPSLCAMKMEACQRQEELRLRPLDLCQGMEVKPCKGEKPIVDPITGKELDCGNGPNRRDCPSGSYCHQTTRFARCCPKDIIQLKQKACEDGWYGCCPDGKTPAQGPGNAGCPSMCGCNKLGSYSDTCDPETDQCRCRPGVGGQKCDRCLPGFWGLPKISSGHMGCIPCGCSTFGSVREDCEQMTGRCVCKPGIQGQKCTICTSHDKILGPNGCVPADMTTPPPQTCKELTCYFGATCFEQGGGAICDCHNECDEKADSQIVCGSDGQTYASACQLRLVACRLQKDIVVQAFGTCKEDMFPGTDWPIRRYTPLQFTQSDESNSPLSKSTRHLLVPDLRYYYDRGGPPLRPAQNSPFPHNRDNDNGSSMENELSLSESDNFYDGRGERIAAAYRPTPATVRVITALLGDLCSDDTDCLIMHSTCVAGACTCLPQYIESSDRQECKESSATEEVRACYSSPCAEGSTCVDLPSINFACICSPNFTGQFCDLPLSKRSYETPSFDGQAYVKLKPLKAYYKLSIEIEFRTYTNNGILLYNQQKATGYGDFVSLAIVNGFVEFRYNLGNGAAVIKSLDKVQLNNFHKVIAKRYHRDGVLKLDDSENVAGQSKGFLKALDLSDDTYVGHIITNYTKVYENIGTNQGFRGCIKRLKIGRKAVDLHENVDEWVLAVNRVQECGSDPCSGSPCHNQGTCHAVDSKLYRCECKPSYTGDFCENVIDPCLSNPCRAGSECFSLDTENFMCECPIDRKGRTCELVDTNIVTKMLEFNGSSFLRFPKLEGVMKYFSLELVFLSKSPNGLILYNGQKKKSRGDFISINLVNGYVQFRFNLGSGVANITSSKPIFLNVWHRLRILRDGREGFLQLDDSPVVKGRSGPTLVDLNLELPFYIGSVPSWREIHRLSGAHKGFKGVLQRLKVNGNPVPISADLPECSAVFENSSACSSGTEPYDGPPCSPSKNPCFNNGLCIPNLDDYACKCLPGFEGKQCQIAKESASIKFTGETFLQYRNRGYKNDSVADYEEELDYVVDEYPESPEDYDMEFAHTDYVPTEYYTDNNNHLDLSWRKAERGNRYHIKIRTFSSDGLLLWRSKTRSIKEDYFSIAVVNGYPELSYNLGKQEDFWAIRSKTRIDDGEWHSIDVKRRKKMGFISVDNEPPIKGISNNGALTLSTNSKLWIGGMPSLPSGLPSAYYKGFQGCIKHISISSKHLNLLKHIGPNKLQFCHDNEI